MAVFIIRNWLAAATLSEHYMNILYHRKNMLSIMEHRLSMSFRFPFEMFPFPSQRVFDGKKSTMAHIHDLPIIFQIKAIGFIKTMCAD